MWTNPAVELFHGTTAADVPGIRAGIDLSRSRQRLDFGPGFYTTTNERQANIWARTTARRRGSDPVVICFLISRDEIARLDALSFVRGDRAAVDYWTFVDHCRKGGADHARVVSGGWYDVVYGPVMNNVGYRRIYPRFDQVSFHTRAAAAILDNGYKGVVT